MTIRINHSRTEFATYIHASSVSELTQMISLMELKDHCLAGVSSQYVPQVHHTEFRRQRELLPDLVILLTFALIDRSHKSYFTAIYLA